MHAHTALAGQDQGGQEYATKGSTKDTFFQMKNLCDKVAPTKILFYGKSSLISWILTWEGKKSKLLVKLSGNFQNAGA